MKKSIKLITLLVFTLITLFTSGITVLADDNSPSTFRASTHDYYDTNVLGITNTINVKKTTDGKYIYCMDVSKRLPNTSILYTKGYEIKNHAISYIIASGYDDSNDTEFFATQAALWIYLLDNGQMADTASGYVAKLKKAAYSSKYANDEIAMGIREILEGAEEAEYASNKVIFEITTKDVTFTLKDGNYVSNKIKLNKNFGGSNYDVEISNQPKGTKITKSSNGFTITIPEESVGTGKTTLKITVKDSTRIYNVYEYTPNNSSYQKMSAPYSERVNVEDDIKAYITKDEIVVSVSKQDITNKEELPGATLIIRDKDGNEKYKWVSGEEPYIIKGIKEGTYTLEEIIAPEGYKLSSEKITFEVKNNGVVTEVVMFNTPEATEIVVVPPTGSNATTISLIFGGLIIIIGSVLIYKNVKKEQ